jgi:hypothetical protein
MSIVPWLLALFVLVLRQASAQIVHSPPDEFVRATRVDADGRLQWAEHAKEKCKWCAGAGRMMCLTCLDSDDDAKSCPECKSNKDRKSPCRECAGAGFLCDPLEKTHCPTCRAAAFLLCTLCMGAGQIDPDVDSRTSDCPGCRGQGGFACGTCNGERLVEVVATKPGLRDADVATLTGALAATDKSIHAVAAFAPKGKNTRQELRQLLKALETAHPLHPAVKRSTKVVEDYVERIMKGKDIDGHEDHEATALKLMKHNAEYYLRRQKRMLELALARARANAKLAEKK